MEPKIDWTMPGNRAKAITAATLALIELGSNNCLVKEGEIMPTFKHYYDLLNSLNAG
jgi:hypothetical protein